MSMIQDASPPLVAVDDDGAVHVRGEVDLSNAGELHAALEAVDPRRSVRVDLSEVTFIDSTGLRQLLVASQKRSATGATVTLVRPSAHVLRLLGISGVTYMFRVETSERTASPFVPQSPAEA